MKISKNDQRNLSEARSQAEKNAAYAMSKLNGNTFQETLKHNNDMIEYHRDRLAIAELKKELITDLIRSDFPGSSRTVYANFLKAEKQGLAAADRFMKKYRCI